MSVSLSDPAAERAILAGICAHGAEAYYDIADIVDTKTFVIDSNQFIWKCLKRICETNKDAVIDIPSILSVATELGCDDFFERKGEREHLRAVTNTIVKLDNLRKFATKIKKLEIARQSIEVVKSIHLSLHSIKGDEPVDHILGLLENPIFDYIGSLNSGNDGPKLMGDGAVEYVKYLRDNPRDMVGISTGFNAYDLSIGGGLRRQAVDVIAARAKVGKAQPLSSLVYTPSGPIRIGDIDIGDQVCTPNGGVATVIAIHPQGIKPVYKVKTINQKETRCCEEHVWLIRHSIRPNQKFELRQLKDFKDYQLRTPKRRYYCHIPIPKIVFFEEQDVERDPYVVGFEVARNEIDDVPDYCIYNSVEVRRKFIEGLFLGGKRLVSSGRAKFFFSKEVLWQKVREVATSLGYCWRATRKLGRPYVEIILDGNPKREEPFVSVEYDGEEECVCITLDTEEGLYLTDDLIVTHNSSIADSAALHIAGKLGIPVLNLDTEMSRLQHNHRILANLSSLSIEEIETGKFGKSKEKTLRVEKAAEHLASIPYYHESIAGKPFEEVLSIMRRWLLKNVGYDANGKLKDCALIYDYLKIMSQDTLSSHLQEYQALGFLMTGLTNFAIKYDVPILAFAQLNRDGITKETTDTIGGSDRILWFCSSLSIFKPKSDNEIAYDGPANGNRKLVTIASRNGKGMSDGEYINIDFNGDMNRISELSVVKASNDTTKKDLDLDEDGDIPF